MPVIECSCGMIMSVPTTEPRACCIRCGGVEFRFVEKQGERVRANATPFLPRTAIAASTKSRGELATIGVAVAEPRGQGPTFSGGEI